MLEIFRPKWDFTDGENTYHAHLTYTIRTPELEAKVKMWNEMGKIEFVGTGSGASGQGVVIAPDESP